MTFRIATCSHAQNRAAAPRVDLMRIFRGAVLQHAGAVHTGIDADKMRNPVLWPNLSPYQLRPLTGPALEAGGAAVGRHLCLRTLSARRPRFR